MTTEEIAMTKILCVEDSDDSLFMLHRRLTRAGFDVKVSTDGAEAVEWAKSLLPDVILMDWNLPGLNGLDATHQLKNQAETNHIPIILVTAHHSEKDRASASAAGCDAYETKPIDFRALVEKIRLLLGRNPTQ
jgi:DNA-binding response OmpR family regulator